jgi:hypothetical protein
VRRGQGGADGICGRFGSADGDRGLGHRLAECALVDPLVRDPGCGGRDGVGDHDHREPVQGGVRDAVDRAGQAGTPGDHDGSWRTGEVGTGGRHDRRGGLAAGQHEAQPGRRRGADHVQVGAATRHAEYQSRPRSSQRRDNRARRVGTGGQGGPL